MFSARYGTLVLVLLTLAAVPTVIHSYVGVTVSDGRTVHDIPLRLAAETGTSTARRQRWGEDQLGATEWFERSYGTSAPVRLMVARTLDAKRVYHHPELAVDYGQSYRPYVLDYFPQKRNVPVHVLRSTRNGDGRTSLYVLHYGDEYVSDPIWFQLRTSVALLFAGRKPMTLFFATQDLPPNGDVKTSASATVLLAAIEAFEQQQ